MLQPNEFLALARRLLDVDPNDADDAALRRSVSSSYYALFHTVLTTAAARFIGSAPSDQRSYTIVYRAFNHGQMRKVCDSLTPTRLNNLLQEQLGRVSSHPDLRTFAVIFSDLQSRRQRADYDPAAEVTFDDAREAFELAERGIAAFEQAPADERTEILALMLAATRR